MLPVFSIDFQSFCHLHGYITTSGVYEGWIQCQGSTMANMIGDDPPVKLMC